MTAANTTEDANAAGEMFTEMWSDFATKMMGNGMAGGADQFSADAARQMRDTFLGSWSDSCDRYMRSDEFRQMMRESMKAAIDLRKQLNEQMGDFQHAMQGASRQDVDRLLQGIEQLETRVNQTFEQIVQQFETLSSRLDKLEATKPSKKSAKATKTSTKKKTAKKTSRKTR